MNILVWSELLTIMIIYKHMQVLGCANMTKLHYQQIIPDIKCCTVVLTMSQLMSSTYVAWTIKHLSYINKYWMQYKGIKLLIQYHISALMLSSIDLSHLAVLGLEFPDTWGKSDLTL